MQSKLIVFSAVAAALLSAACGGATQPAAIASPSPSPAASPSPSPATTTATIAVAANATLGKILVDGSGKTVYLFVADTGKVSTCYSTCAMYWPPVLTVGAPKVGTGAKSSLLGTTKRTDGTTEVTYAGHPLYYFVTDKPGDANGQGVNGFGGLWWVLTPSGAAMH